MPQWVAFCTARENLKSTGTVSVHADNVDIQAASLASLLPWHRVRPCPAIYFKPANTHALCLTPVSRAQNTNPGRTMGKKKNREAKMIDVTATPTPWSFFSLGGADTPRMLRSSNQLCLRAFPWKSTIRALLFGNPMYRCILVHTLCHGILYL